MLNTFLFAGLPYIALFVLVGGSIYRFRTQKFTYSALSSQFLEHRQLLWGSVPWHAGIFIILGGHLLAFCFPGLWQQLVANHAILMAVETLGILATVLCIAGLVVLLGRRVMSGKLQSVSTPMDFVVVILLLVQVLLGLWVALAHRWGAAWAGGALAPYLLSLLKLQPDVAYVADMPGLVKLHIVGAWLFLLAIPFSRLIHIFSLPIAYLWRPYQKVVWANTSRFRQAEAMVQAVESRRYFLRAGVALAGGLGLMGIGVSEKLVRYFKGPKHNVEEESELLAKKLERLNMTAEQRALELERMRDAFIKVCHLGELDLKKGKYFIDYEMRPALAFLGADGMPVLISAKCTHLGCTVGSDLDSQGRVLCPCHVSFFDIQTGKPNDGAPAKTPLPRIGWVLKNAAGDVLVEQGPDGKRTGAATPEQLKSCTLYIAKKYASETA